LKAIFTPFFDVKLALRQVKTTTGSYECCSSSGATSNLLIWRGSLRQGLIHRVASTSRRPPTMAAAVGNVAAAERALANVGDPSGH